MGIQNAIPPQVCIQVVFLIHFSAAPYLPSHWSHLHPNDHTVCMQRALKWCNSPKYIHEIPGRLLQN